MELLATALEAAATKGWTKTLVFVIAGLGALLIFLVGQAAARYSSGDRQNRIAGRLSATLLVVHSTFDGTAIFAASTISLQMGLIVGLGVVAHDVCDGLNTILLSTGGQNPEWRDYGFLALDALAPIVGGLIAAYLFTVSPALVVVFLSLAADRSFSPRSSICFPARASIHHVLDQPCGLLVDLVPDATAGIIGVERS